MSMPVCLSRTLIAGLFATAAALAQAATPTHVYLLNDASDALGGPSLTGLGGVFGSSAYGQVGYSFGAQQGLSLLSAANASVYSIDFAMALDNIDGYRRLVDFKDLSSDTGLYVLSGGLNFYNVTTGPAAFAVQELARVTITRDAGGMFAGYVNGVLQISFADTGGLGEFSAAQQVAYFFRDDNAVGGEASAGFVDYIRIYDVALSAAEVAALPSPVPEPAGWALLLAGAAALLPLARRRPG